MADICWSGWLCIRQDGQLMFGEGEELCMWSSVSFCVKPVFSGAFEEAMRWCKREAMEAGYGSLNPARLCSAQRIFPLSKCA